MKWQKFKAWLKKWVKRILNWRFLVCFLLAWLITNGWSYICFILAIIFNINWLKAVASVYISFLWLPFTPEKIVTVIIALFLLKKLFPNDKKTLAELEQMAKEKKNKKHQKEITGGNNDQ